MCEAHQLRRQRLVTAVYISAIAQKGSFFKKRTSHRPDEVVRARCEQKAWRDSTSTPETAAAQTTDERVRREKTKKCVDYITYRKGVCCGCVKTPCKRST